MWRRRGCSSPATGGAAPAKPSPTHTRASESTSALIWTEVSEVIDHYGVQLHNLPPNSLLEMSAYVALCEGFLGIRPSLLLFRFYFHVRRNSITAGVPYITGTISFSLRRDRAYPKISASDSVKQWPATFFYHRDIPPPGRLLLTEPPRPNLPGTRLLRLSQMI